MKKLISIALALALALSVAAVSGISVSAEEYDYYTIVDPADKTTYPDNYDFGKGNSAYVYKDGLTKAYNVTPTFEANSNADGKRMLKMTRTSDYDGSSINYYDSQNLSTLANKSVGFRVWVQAEPDNTNCVTDKNILSFGFDKVGTAEDSTTTHTIYATADWDNPYLGKLTTEGAWYTFMWGSKNMNSGSLYINNNRFTYAGAASSNVIDADFLANMQGILIGFNDAYHSGSVYYIGEWQFIYNKGDAPSSAITEPTVTMLEGAAMRIDGATEGIRFSATVPTAGLTALKAAGATIKDFGMLVADSTTNPTVDSMTVGNSVESTAGNVAESANVVAAKYKGTKPFEDEKSGLTEIVGSLVEIKTANANKQFVARAYIEYTLAGDETVHYVYSNISTPRSIAYVAKQIQSGAGEDADYYSSLCAEHKAVVDKWANRYAA